MEKTFTHDARAAIPPFSQSDFVRSARLDRFRYHQASGDMWPLTWASDGNLYGAAGDNRNSPMNFWRVRGEPQKESTNHQLDWILDLIDNLPLDPAVYCTDPRVHSTLGIKPAGLIECNGTLYFAVQTQNYGTDPSFNRQTNVHGWIVTSRDYGQTWDREATATDFFTGRLASCHFVQYGKANSGALDEFVYAFFPGVGHDGKSYWENGDLILLGRVPADQILHRNAWSFFAGTEDAEATWSADETAALPVFEYPSMTGENHVSYNPGIGRYIMGNYAFIDEQARPRPYHQGPLPDSTLRSQLTLFEAEKPWGPWGLFLRDDDWGTFGDYQPNFPTKWMHDGGRTMWMVSSGSFGDYCFTAQKLTIEVETQHPGE
jgi:hypothetical protein